MIYRILKFVFLTLLCDNIVYGNLGPCEIAIVGIKGECMSVFECQELMSIVDKTNKTFEDKLFLKRSLCGIDNNAPAVCCPLQNAQPKQCTTPEGKPGQCLNFYSCTDMQNLLKTLPVPRNVMQFVQKSKCIDADRHTVCCGPIPKFDDVKNGSCTLTSFPPDPLNGCCGIDASYKNKIYGGTTTAIDQYPWLAMAEYARDKNNTVVDIGALISAKYVVCAASSAIGTNGGKPVRIRLGEYDTSHEGSDCTPVEGGGLDCTDGTITIEVEQIIVHPLYRINIRTNNIALIRMVSAAPYTDFIRPICLPSIDWEQSSEPINFIAAGWGAISNKKPSSNVRMHVTLPHVKLDQCRKYLSSLNRPAVTRIANTLLSKEGQLCAGGVLNEDTCLGDITLMFKNGSMYELSGIVSYGASPCGQKNIPAIYTNVYFFNTWIKDSIVD